MYFVTQCCGECCGAKVARKMKSESCRLIVLWTCGMNYRPNLIFCTYLIMCMLRSCHQNSSDPLSHGLHKTCEPWYVAQDVSSQSLKVNTLWGGASIGQNGLASTSFRCLGILEAKLICWTLCHVPQMVPEQILQCSGTHPVERGRRR